MINPDYATNKLDIEGDVSDQVVFRDQGILSHITIWKDVDGGSLTLTDTNGNAIIPVAITDYGGSFIIRLLVENGVKATTASFTGGRLSIFYSK